MHIHTFFLLCMHACIYAADGPRKIEAVGSSFMPGQAGPLKEPQQTAPHFQVNADIQGGQVQTYSPCRETLNFKEALLFAQPLLMHPSTTLPHVDHLIHIGQCLIRIRQLVTRELCTRSSACGLIIQCCLLGQNKTWAEICSAWSAGGPDAVW